MPPVSIFASALNEFKKRNIVKICLKYDIHLETKQLKASKLAHAFFSYFTDS